MSVRAERWREVFDAADRALEMAREEREAFIAKCSADDPALGIALAELLASADGASLLDGSAVTFAGPLLAELSSEPDPIATTPRIGSYRIVGAIGHGGMGAVYLAERADDQYRKRVALKVLPGWSAGDEHRIRRFLEERQILAALEHPDVARLLDGGITTDGLPWFAMEYVEGVPIDLYCDGQYLTIECRLELFCRVCAAVQYAHRNLVVHRDLKPANILVSVDGRVKLLDFGIAKLLGGDPGAALTQTGERIMTPLYASPEQIRAEPVSTASDVYALGALLYELLSGRHAYRPASWQPHDVARAILEQDPERPSTAVLRDSNGARLNARPQDVASARGTSVAKLGRRLLGDLDAIVLKALEKDPRHRYGSAEQLEADVRRHLAGLPVAARPSNRLYQARKFLRRHRAAVAATLGGALLVLGFSVITTVQSVRIRTQAERLALERDRAEAVQHHLLNVFRTSVPSPSEGRGATARDVLDSSAARVERDLSQQPGMRAELLFSMGQAYDALGMPDRARQLLESAIALQRSSGDNPRAFASTLAVLGGVLLEQQKIDSAEKAFEEAQALQRKLLGAHNADVARTLNGLAAVRLARGRYQEAEALARTALTIDRTQPGDNRLDVAQSLRNVAHALLAEADYADAAKLYKEALSLLQGRLPGDHVEIARTMLELSVALQGKGERTEADSLLRSGAALLRRLAPAASLTQPSDSTWLHILAAPPFVANTDRTASVVPTRAFDSKIAFESDRSGPDPDGNLGHHEIYIMNPDGSDQRRLTHSDGRVASPVFSPDGRRIAYQTTGAERDIFVIDVDGGRPVRVTNMAARGLGAGGASWSPDGKRLAFHSSPQADIYTINVDGTGLQNLTNHSARDKQATWSPKGGKIAFVSDRDGPRDVYVMNEDGSHAVRLTVNAVQHQSQEWSPKPNWSPDGRQLAFVSDLGGSRQIYVINADGSGRHMLTNTIAENFNPSWSPDGRQIAFSRQVLGHLQVFVMNADGSNPTRLTELSAVAFNGFTSWGRNPPRPERAQPGPR